MQSTSARGTSRWLRLSVLPVILATFILGVAFAQAKQKALGFHFQDYPFYAQFLEKMSDATLSKRYFLNPNGQNFLGFWGTEGESSFHQSLHLEPIKYAEAMASRLFQGTFPVFVLRFLVLLVAPVYLLAIYPRRTPSDDRVASLTALCFVLIPVFPLLATFDLRPFTYLIPLLFMVCMAVIFRRPTAEIVILFILLLLVREEALILGAVVVLMTLADSGREQPSARRAALPLILVWVSWGAAVVAYFQWTGYQNAYHIEHFSFPVLAGFARHQMTLRNIAIAASAAILGLLAVLVLRTRRDLWSNADLRRTLAFALLFPPLGWNFCTFFLKHLVEQNQLTPRAVGHILIFSEHWALATYSGLIMLVMLAELTAARPVSRRWLTVLLGFIAVGSLGLNFGPSSSAFQRFKQYRVAQAATAPVWAFSRSVDRLKTSVLCDYETCQAFCDFERLYVYRRLPCYLVTGKARYYPANDGLLRSLLSNEIDYVVVSKNSLPAITKLTKEARLEAVTTVVQNNGQYTIFRITHSDRARPGFNGVSPVL